MYRYNQLIFPSQLEKDTRFFALAGFALNGPVGAPFLLKDDTEPYEVLGDCPLADAYRNVKSQGITPLILRLNGSHGEGTLIHDTTGVPVLRFTTFEATDESNNIKIHLFPTHLIVYGLYSEKSFYFADFRNISELATEIKRELYFGQGEVDVEILNNVSLEGLVLSEKYLAFDGADDGFNYIGTENDEGEEEKVQNQLELLKQSFLEEEGTEFYSTGELNPFTIDTVLFPDIPYERAPQELARIFGEFARAKTNEQNIFCSVVLGTETFGGSRYSEENEDQYTEQVQKLLDIKPVYIEGNSYLQHVEVVVGMQDSSNPGKESMPCASSYASMRYKLRNLTDSATNKALPGISVLYGDELKQEEVAKLSASGYICIVPSIKKGFVPFSSKNLYPGNTFYSKPHYLRSLHYDVGKLAGFFNEHIGQPLSTSLLQLILNNVDSAQRKLLDKHPLYKNLSIEVLDYTYSKIKISFAFEFYGEIERVKSSFEYVPSSEVNITWQ